jgi:hypothetical protein
VPDNKSICLKKIISVVIGVAKKTKRDVGEWPDLLISGGGGGIGEEGHEH